MNNEKKLKKAISEFFDVYINEAWGIFLGYNKAQVNRQAYLMWLKSGYKDQCSDNEFLTEEGLYHCEENDSLKFLPRTSKKWIEIKKQIEEFFGWKNFPDLLEVKYNPKGDIVEITFVFDRHNENFTIKDKIIEYLQEILPIGMTYRYEDKYDASSFTVVCRLKF